MPGLQFVTISSAKGPRRALFSSMTSTRAPSHAWENGDTRGVGRFNRIKVPSNMVLRGSSRVNRPSFLVIGFWAAMVLSCSGTMEIDDGGPLVGAPPLQVKIVAGPTILVDPSPNESRLIVTLSAVDSLAHRSWRPTRVVLQVDQGVLRELLVPPYACINPRGGGGSFPHNFSWWSCNSVLVTTVHVLTEPERAAMSTQVGAPIVETRIFSSLGLAQYTLRIPTGRTASTIAQRRASALAFAQRADIPDFVPICVGSDQIPPPPCPPWFLTVAVPFALESSGSGDSLSLHHGSRVRVTYVDALGKVYVAELNIP